MNSRWHRPMLAVGGMALLSVAIALGVWWGGHYRGLSAQSSLAAAERLQAEQASAICSGRNATGVGLRGEYFPAESFQGGASVVTLDETVDFLFDERWPPQSEGAASRSVRWTGWVKAPLGGMYHFHLDVPGAIVRVGREVVVDGTSSSATSALRLDAGRFYPVLIEVANIPHASEPSVSQRVALEWTAPHGARYVVPRALLYLPTPTVAASGASTVSPAEVRDGSAGQR